MVLTASLDRDRRTLSSLSGRKSLVSSPDSTCLPRRPVRERPWNMEQGVAAVGSFGSLRWLDGTPPPAFVRQPLPHRHQRCARTGPVIRCGLPLEDCVLRCDLLSIDPETRRLWICLLLHSAQSHSSEREIPSSHRAPVRQFDDNTAPASTFGPTAPSAGPNRCHAPILPASAVTGPVSPVMESTEG